MHSIRNNRVLAMGGFIAVLVSGFTFSIIESLIPLFNSSTTENVNGNIEDSLIWILSPLLIAPIIEEFVFRKWLPNTFTDVIGRKRSILLSTVLFTFLHLEIFFFPYLINGLIYSYIYEKTKDIKIPILIHILYNLTVFILTI